MKISQKFTIIGVIAIVIAVAYCLSLFAAALHLDGETTATTEAGYALEYENRLFDTAYVHTIDIQIAEMDWQDLKDNSLKKEYHDCNLVVDGETFYHVGVRTKGNSTLVQSMVQGWDRQSLVFNFGKFNESQRYYGLDKLSLYNNACDSSYIKNMVCFDMMRQMGVPTPLCSFSAVYLNGEYIGLYTSIEGVDESFAYRNFGEDYGQIYKPEQYDLAALLRGDTTGITINAGALVSSSGSVEISDFLQASDSTVALQYQGEDLTLYREIWDNAAFKIGANDKRRVVTALRHINEQTGVWDYADVDKLARYFAVSTFVLNTDGYLTNMGHNYYLYEKNGVLSMLPWDYDLSLGTVGIVGDDGSATDFINLAIDTPVIHTTVKERPMFDVLLSDETGYALYHEALRTLLNQYIYNGYLEETVAATAQMLRPYVESDPINHGSTEKFDAAVDALLAYCALRAQSIEGQLDGTIPSTADGQKAMPEVLIDASDFTSPDSGSLFELLMPEGSGLYLDDVLETLLSHAKLFSLLKKMPISDLGNIAALGTGNSGAVESLAEKGLIRNPQNIRDAVIYSAIESVQTVGWVVISILLLIAALIWIFHYDRKRRPAAVQRRMDV